MSLRLFANFTELLLEVEVAPSSEEEFTSRYAQLAGSNPVDSPFYQSQDNKWGIECRAYFNAQDWVIASLRTLGHHIEIRTGDGYRPEYSFRINSQELFWQLVEHGYRLGENAPIPFEG